MKNFFYTILLVLSLSFTGYSSYYAYQEYQKQLLAPKTNVTPKQTQQISLPDLVLTTKTGKRITIHTEESKASETSSFTITPTLFATNTPITLETPTLTSSFLADINQDGFDELILVTETQDAHGQIIVYTTKNDTGLTPVLVPDIKEDDTRRGGLFEGYGGHDSFVAINNSLTREFPLLDPTSSSTQTSLPTKKRKLIYSMQEIQGSFTLTLSPYEDKPITLPLTATTSPATSTKPKK